MTFRDINRGIRYEKRKAKERRGRPLGGPGLPDYQRGDVFGEVKCRKTKVTKPELQYLVTKKGITEVNSKAGFTQPAIEYRDRWQPDVRLIYRRKDI